MAMACSRAPGTFSVQHLAKISQSRKNPISTPGGWPPAQTHPETGGARSRRRWITTWRALAAVASGTWQAACRPSIQNQRWAPVRSRASPLAEERQALTDPGSHIAFNLVEDGCDALMSPSVSDDGYLEAIFSYRRHANPRAQYQTAGFRDAYSSRFVCARWLWRVRARQKRRAITIATP